MAKRRKKQSGFEVLAILVVLLLAFIVKIVIRIIFLTYDLITMFSSGYRSKSGNGFFKTYFDKGNYGEFLLYRKILSRFGKENVYTNLYLEGENTDLTEIDVLAISKEGIFVFEMKNYSGWIYGSEKDEQWTQAFNRNSKFRFYNPLRQNYAHTKATEKYLNINESDIIPVVVFSNHSKLKKINVKLDKHIIQLKEVNRFIKNMRNNNGKIFKESELVDFRKVLILSSNMPDELKTSHIRQVNELISHKKTKNVSSNLFVDKELYKLLLEERSKIAKFNNLSYEEVFSNDAAINLAKFKPKNIKELEQIEGFNNEHISIYGEYLIRIISE